MAGEVESSSAEAEVEVLELDRWAQRRSDIEVLLEMFEPRMSPRSLFDQPPLSRCDEQTKMWLGTLVHQMWLGRYPVREWVEAARDALYKADRAWLELAQALDAVSPVTVERLVAAGPEIERLQEACQRLASAIEKFPSSVLVV